MTPAKAPKSGRAETAKAVAWSDYDPQFRPRPSQQTRAADHRVYGASASPYFPAVPGRS